MASVSTRMSMCSFSRLQGETLLEFVVTFTLEEEEEEEQVETERE